MNIKEIEKKPFDEITDEEWAYYGKYKMKHPTKEKPKLHKCIHCKHLMFYDDLGEQLWECYFNPCMQLGVKEEEDKLMTNKGITHKRRCDKFEKDPDVFNPNLRR